MRTFPAFYAYLLLTAFLLLGLKLFDWSQFWRATIYLENYHPRSLWTQSQWFVGHSWSLAVEEQFYLAVALLFSLFNRAVLTIKGMQLILIVIICLSPLIRLTYSFFDQVPDVLVGSLHRSFETVADTLAVGGLVALYHEKIRKHTSFKFLSNKLFWVVLVVILSMVLDGSWLRSLVGYGPRYAYNAFGITFTNIGLAILMLSLIDGEPSKPFIRFLNTNVMMSIGLWSYSIYLWQHVWLYAWEIPLIIKYAGLIVCALGSYYLIELKFLSLRNKYLDNTAH